MQCSTSCVCNSVHNWNVFQLATQIILFYESLAVYFSYFFFLLISFSPFGSSQNKFFLLGNFLKKKKKKIVDINIGIFCIIYHTVKCLCIERKAFNYFYFFFFFKCKNRRISLNFQWMQWRKSLFFSVAPDTLYDNPWCAKIFFFFLNILYIKR